MMKDIGAAVEKLTHEAEEGTALVRETNEWNSRVFYLMTLEKAVEIADSGQTSEEYWDNQPDHGAWILDIDEPDLSSGDVNKDELDTTIWDSFKFKEDPELIQPKRPDRTRKSSLLLPKALAGAA